ncbi:MAG: hypothetical protein UR33_C0015G0011 [Candidatus Woesebacteria bacterium GW2011_GWA2_33_20]|nr:MAG: hypothetical protein UR33_C0015G0011 [Candidatus Woesebacteria bacterium GW2011_GWA2_33_20]
MSQDNLNLIIKAIKKILGEIANVLTYLYRSKYNWEVSPDIHLFSEKNFNQRLNNNSLFIREIVKGKTIYEN